MGKIIAYGELMLRIPLGEKSFLTQLPNYGGCELNSLAFLSQRGYDCEFLSSFPDSYVGQIIKSYVESLNINCNFNFNKDRLGVYYTKTSETNQPTEIYYDRKNSSFSNYLVPKNDLKKILSNKNFVILSGITPALSPTCQENIYNIIDVAKLYNVKVVYDINFRPSLWSIKECRNFNKQILPQVDYLFANSQTLRSILEIDTKSNDIDIFKESEDSLNQIIDQYNFSLIAMTIRKKNKLASLINYKNTKIRSEIFEIDQIDRVGAGDSFLGSVMYGVLKGWGISKISLFSTSSFAIAHTFKGDVNRFIDEEIIKFKSNFSLG